MLRAIIDKGALFLGSLVDNFHTSDCRLYIVIVSYQSADKRRVRPRLKTGFLMRVDWLAEAVTVIGTE